MPDLDRRRLLAGVAGAAVLGGGAALVARSGGDPDALPVRVDTLDAPGSTAGEARVPAPDGPLLLDLFATWCPPCAESMPALAAAEERYSDVQFLSVTNERFGGGLDAATLREWWRDHGGAWTLGHDPESRLMAALGAGALPHLALFDPDGEVVWDHGGPLEGDTLDDALATHLDD
jgi:thiol-disulfide isomerase/thioredoxin